jgi:hypothetical protein
VRRSDEILDDGLGEPGPLEVLALTPLHLRVPPPRRRDVTVAVLVALELALAGVAVARYRPRAPALRPPELVSLNGGAPRGTFTGVLRGLGGPSPAHALRAAQAALDETCYPQLAVVSLLRQSDSQTGRYVVTGGQRLPAYTKIRRVPPYRVVLTFDPDGGVRYRLSAPGLGCF